jgi:ferritin-like metal-binding protein YciE
MSATKENGSPRSKETLLQWLRDAHAMESANVDHLQLQLKRVDGYPQLEQRIRQHLEESKGQEQRIEQALEKLGSSTSAVKAAVTKLTGYAEAAMASLTRDEVLKQAIGSYAFEHFEIGNYRALIAAAKACGENEVARLVEQNLREEEGMAQWFEQNLPQVTQQYLQREASAA